VANHLGLKFRTVAIPSIVNDDPEDAHHTRPAYDAAAAAVANPDADTGASMTTVGEFFFIPPKVSSTSSLKIVGLTTDPQLQPRGSRHQPTE